VQDLNKQQAVKSQEVSCAVQGSNNQRIRRAGLGGGRIIVGRQVHVEVQQQRHPLPALIARNHAAMNVLQRALYFAQPRAAQRNGEVVGSRRSVAAHDVLIETNPEVVSKNPGDLKRVENRRPPARSLSRRRGD
jgi:hypothetical protein